VQNGAERAYPLSCRSARGRGEGSPGPLFRLEVGPPPVGGHPPQAGWTRVGIGPLPAKHNEPGMVLTVFRQPRLACPDREQTVQLGSEVILGPFAVAQLAQQNPNSVG